MARPQGLAHDYYVIIRDPSIFPELSRALGKFVHRKAGVGVELIGKEDHPLGLSVTSLVCDPDFFKRMLFAEIKDVTSIEVYDLPRDEEYRGVLSEAYTLIGDLTRKLAEATHPVADEKELRRLREEASRLSKRLEEKTAAQEDLTRRLGDLSRNHQDLERRYQNLEVTNQVARDDFDRERKARLSLEGRLGESLHELEELRRTASFLPILTAWYEAVYRQLADGFAALRERNVELVRVGTGLQDEAVDFLRRMEEKQREVDAVREELTQLRTEGLTENMSARDLLIEAFRKNYAPDFQRSEARYQEIFPGGVSQGLEIAATPLKDYLLSVLGTRNISRLGIDIDQDLPDIRNALEAKTKNFGETFPDFQIQYRLAQAYITSQAGLALAKRREDRAYLHASRITDEYEQQQEKWRSDAEAASALLQSWDASLTDHQRCSEIPFSRANIPVGCYAFSYHTEEKYHLCLLLPAKMEQLGNGLGLKVLAGMMKVLDNYGEEVNLEPLRGVVGYEVTYSKNRPDAQKIKNIVDQVEKDFPRTIPGNLGIELKLTFFGEVN
jgi:hypothetical protein